MTEQTESFSLDTLSATPLDQRMEYVRKHEHELNRLTPQELDHVALELCRTAPAWMRKKYPINQDSPTESPQDMFERLVTDKSVHDAQAEAIAYAKDQFVEATDAERTTDFGSEQFPFGSDEDNESE